MSDDKLTADSNQPGLRFTIRAARVITGVTLEGLDFEVSGASPEEAQQLIDHFWDLVQRAEATTVVSGDRGSDSQRVREALLKKGWTQSELGKRTGVSSQLISNFLNGKSGISPGKRRAIFDALEIEILDNP